LSEWERPAWLPEQFFRETLEDSTRVLLKSYRDLVRKLTEVTNENKELREASYVDEFLEAQAEIAHLRELLEEKTVNQQAAELLAAMPQTGVMH
jgi:DNA mismatch repair ATPase MutS